MATATTTSTDTGQHTPTRGRQREAQQPVTQQEERRNQTAVDCMAMKNTEGSRPMMATCSPRVGIRLASLCQACLRRRNIE